MAIQLEANYSKKIGLPQFSSHQFSLTIKSELGDMNQVQAEANRLYELLQSNVDREIQQVGFMPEAKQTQNGNGNHLREAQAIDLLFHWCPGRVHRPAPCVVLRHGRLWSDRRSLGGS